MYVVCSVKLEMKHKCKNRYDVIIVGSGPVGSAAAILYAEQGLSVGLIEKSKDINSYKPVCTHFLQGVATPILKKLNVVDEIEKSGAIKNFIQLWTKWGWIKPDPAVSAEHHGYNVRRKTLDPILRKRAAAHENVTLLQGYKMTALIFSDPKKVIGVEADDLEGGEKHKLFANLIVGADGRNSIVAKKINASYEKRKNNRTFYVSYYKDLKLTSGLISQLWFWGKHVAYAFPCDGDLTLLCIGLHDEQLSEFKKDYKTNFHNFFKELPDGPDMDSAERVANITVGPNMDTQRAVHQIEGVALIGDAMLSIDPYAGTGVAFGLLSADWLVEKTCRSLLENDPIALLNSVRDYENIHKKKLKEHEFIISSYSSGREFNYIFPPERAVLSSAVYDQKVANKLDLFLNREVNLSDLITFSFLARLVRAQFLRAFKT